MKIGHHFKTLKINNVKLNGNPVNKRKTHHDIITKLIIINQVLFFNIRNIFVNYNFEKSPFLSLESFLKQN